MPASKFVISCRARLVFPVILLLLPGLAAATPPPAIRISQPTTTTAEELSIAVNPADPDILAAGANLRFHFRSADGGATWTEHILSSSLAVAGDPCVVFDADGNLYYVHLSNPADGSWLDRIVVQKSTDGGLSWSDGAGVGHNPPRDQDKAWLAADRTSSPYRGNLYLAWTEFDHYGSVSSADSTRILFARSLDQGETWSPPLRISDRGGNCLDEDETVEGAVPAVGPEGQIYLAWSGHDEIRFDRSYDGGATFDQDILVTTQPGGWDFAVSGVWRANGMPITACDVSAGPHRGRIYVVFSDQRNGTADTDVFICSSDDEGTTWTEPRRVNEDQGPAHQFFPWLTVDPVTGTVAVVYYDRRNTMGDATEVTISASGDGAATFSHHTVSNQSFTPWSNVFFGDYIGIDAWNGKIYAAWMAMDEGDLSVWMARLAFPSAVGDEAEPRVETSLLMRMPAVTSSRRTRISFTTYRDAAVNLQVFDLRGRLVRTLVSERRAAGEFSEMWDGSDRGGRQVASGMYLVRLQSGPDAVTRKIVVRN